MARKEGDKQLTTNISSKEYEEVRAYCETKGISLAALVRTGISSAMLSDYKKIVPDHADEIDDVRMKMDFIMDAYRSALERANDAYDIAANKVRGQLEALGNLTDQVKEKDTQISSLRDQIEKLQMQLTEKNSVISGLQKELEEAKNNSADMEGLKKENTELKSKLADLQLRHNEEIKQLQDDNFQKILEIVKAR